MPTYHRSQRLRLVGTGPKVEQLQEGRFRLTFTCSSTNPSEAWMQGNKSQIFAAYGTLESAEMSIAGIAPRTSEAYSDMVLFRTEANPSERDLIVTLIYETATTSFVKSQDDKIDFELNGLQRVTRVTIAKTGTSLPSVTIGTTSITVNTTACKLASRSVEENDAFIQITETYLQEGTVSKSIDNVGSQLAQVITTFGADPAGISGYSIASKEESNFSGYQTNTFRFLKNDVQLSLSVDKQSPLKTEIQEWFNPESDNDRDSKTGYSLINEQQSNVQGIPTTRYTFAKDGVEISKSEDNVGSQLAIVRTFFNPASDPTESGYVVAKKDQSDFGGIKTVQYTFLKQNVQLSLSVDNDSPLKTEVREYFKPDASKETLANYSLVNKQESNVDGIPTERYTFAKNNVTLSTSEEKVGSQLAIVKEVFNGTPSTPSGYSIANESVSSVDGIPTKRFTFLKPSILSRTDDKQNPACPITIVAFDKDESNSGIFASTGAEVDSDIYVLVSKTERDFEGIETFEMRFEKKVYLLSEKENEFGRIENVLVEQGATNYALQTMPGTAVTVNDSANSYIIAQEITEGIVKKRTTTYSTAGIESASEDLVGSTKVITITSFITAPTTANAATYSNDGSDAASNFILISDTNNRIFGVDLFTYRFARKNAIVSTSYDLVGSQQAFVVEKFGDSAPAEAQTINGVDLTDYSLAKKDESNVDGIKTFRYTFLKPGIISTSVDLAAASTVVQIEKFGATAPTNTEVNTAAGTSSETYTLVSKKITNLSGIKTHSYTFINTNSGIMISAKRVFEDGFTIKEAYQLSSETKTPEAIATDLATAATSGTTVALTPNITIPIDTSTNQHHTLFLDTNEDLTSVPKRFSQVLINIDTGAGDDLANGILVNQYQTHEIFNYPGEVDITQVDYGGNNDFSLFSGIVQVPITASIQSTVFEFIQTGSSIQASDYVLSSSSGLWRPNNWGNYHVTILGNSNKTVFEESKQWKGYRIIQPSFKVKGTGYGTNIRWEGNQYLYNTSGGTFIFSANTGPPSPVGSKWTLDVDISPIGLSAAGTPIFKKTVVITDPIPLQRENSLPY
jgi:hypothetical protein